LFLDEPTTGVDAVSRKEFWEMLQLLKAEGITIIVSTPYMDEANLCDKVALIQAGKILQIDTPQKVYAQPINPTVARFIGIMNEVPTVVSGNTVVTLGSNFSLGTHLFFRIVRDAANLVNGNSDFDVMVHEYHHARKVDSPSGTAHTIAHDIMQRVERKTAIVTETQHQRIDPHALHVTSTRGGSVIGKHVVTLDSPFENIEIVHNAKNRSGFAQGALLAAAWIADRKGCYDVSEIIDDLEALYRTMQ